MGSSRMCPFTSSICFVCRNDKRSIEGKGGIRIGGNVINNSRLADNTVVIAETETGPQQLMDILVQENKIKGFYFNCTKSFTMVFSKYTIIPACNITVHGKRIVQLNIFIYLDSLFTSDRRCEHNVRRRIGIAKSTLLSMEKVPNARNIEIQLRI